MQACTFAYPWCRLTKSEKGGQKWPQRQNNQGVYPGMVTKIIASYVIAP